MITGRSIAPVLSGIQWVLVSLIAWQLAALLRWQGWFPTASLSFDVFDVFLLTVIPALAAYAWVRLFLAVIQAGYGSFNSYTVTGSPWSVVFWFALVVAIVGHGVFLSTGVLLDQMPDAISKGDFAEEVILLHDTVGLWLLGLGAIGMSAPIMVLGMGVRQHPLLGPERLLVAVGSLLTFGTITLIAGVGGGHFLAAVVASGAVTVLAFALMPSDEVTYDPVGLLFVPGTATGCLILFGWALMAGGQPTWPW